MDDAERWLRENDPCYSRTSEAWKHIRETGDYEPPWREVPVGLGEELQELVDVGAGGYVEALEPRACAALSCGQAFYPWRVGERFCSDLCQKQEKRREQWKPDERRACEADDCDVSFYPEKPWQKFCSPSCRKRINARARRSRLAA